MSLEAPRRIESDPTRVRALLRCLDGLRFAFQTCFAAHDRVRTVLRKIEANWEQGAATEDAIAASGDLWLIVDCLQRIRLLLDRAPVLPKREPDIQAFMRALQPVENLRHYIQHVKGEISGDDGGAPLWGVVSWTGSDDSRECFTLVLGTLHLAQSLAGIAYDRQAGFFVRTLELSAGQDSIDVDSLVGRARRLDSQIGAWANSITFEDGQKYDYRPEVLPVIYSKFVHRPSESA